MEMTIARIYFSRLVPDPNNQGALMPAVFRYATGMAVHGVSDLRTGFWIGQITGNDITHAGLSADGDIRGVDPGLWNTLVSDLDVNQSTYLTELRAWLNMDDAALSKFSSSVTVGDLVTFMIGRICWPVLRDIA